MARARSTQGVVLPNMLAVMTGRLPMAVLSPSRACASPAAMPTIAHAALARILVEIRFRPAMSTTEYIMVMSLVPTKGRVSPDAMGVVVGVGNTSGTAPAAPDH